MVFFRILDPDIIDSYQDDSQELTVLEENMALKDYYLTKKYPPLIVSYNNKREIIPSNSNNQVFKGLN